MAEYQWVCSCGEVRPPTTSDYSSLMRLKEHRGHTYKLVDKETGEVVATNAAEAVRKGYISKKEAIEAEVEFTPEGEALFAIRAWLPATVFSLFRYARVNALSGHKDIVSFLCEYAEYGFMKKHNLALSLAPVEMGEDRGKEIEELRNTVAALTEKVEALTKKEA